MESLLSAGDKHCVGVGLGQPTAPVQQMHRWGDESKDNWEEILFATFAIESRLISPQRKDCCLDNSTQISVMKYKLQVRVPGIHLSEWHRSA